MAPMKFVPLSEHKQLTGPRLERNRMKQARNSSLDRLDASSRCRVFVTRQRGRDTPSDFLPHDGGSLLSERAPRNPCRWESGFTSCTREPKGRTFKSMIQSYVDVHEPLNKLYIPLYETTEGKKSYELTLTSVRKNFPQHVEEIQGTADGAEVPFYKLFLLHIDEILPSSLQKKAVDNFSGCSTVCSNIPGQEILGHNEDALAETLNHFYFVSAHVIADAPKGRWKVKEEKFTSLCYAGTLPGFTMSYNHHGLLFSVNVIRAKSMYSGRTPRSILTRALLAAENLSQAEEILKDSGTGIGDAVSINMTFLKQEGNRIFYNAEVAPAECEGTDSVVSIATARSGEHIYHCNRLLRLKTPESSGLLIESSKHRHKVMNSLPAPKCCLDVHQILGDDSEMDFPIFRNSGPIKTIATGIFNLGKMTWAIFTDNPKTNDPIVEFPILL